MATTRLPRSSGQTGSSPTNLGVHAEVGDGQVKEWAEDTDQTLTEAYIKLVRTGLDNVDHPDKS